MIRINDQILKPMLAAPMSKKPTIFEPGLWVIEEKYDGHRIMVVKKGMTLLAESRLGTNRELPRHLRDAFASAPDGVYDGELFAPGKKCYGVKEIGNGPDLVFVVFDIVACHGTIYMDKSYIERRHLLQQIFAHKCWDPNHNNDQGAVANDLGCGNPECGNHTGKLVRPFPVLSLAPGMLLRKEEDIEVALRTIWGKGGEGVILKHTHSVYTPGKRPMKKHWIKIKRKGTAVLTVTGFEPSRGEINNRGPYAIVALIDDQGYTATVKTKNDAELAKFEKDAPGFMEMHPAIGRKLRIEYQERTEDGGYREPRWDRWEDE
jgi:ATP-dependent DNA ligase